MNGKISIIIPFYKSKKTIARCVESVLNQTYKNFEAIFVNDGGTDGSIDILREYQKNDSRIVIIDNEHKGVSGTRNEGIRHATGEFIQFLDSDDYLEINMFERMIEEQQKHNADLVICNYNHPSIKNYLGDCVLDLNKMDDLLKYVQTTFAMVVPWNKLYRRSLLVSYYDETVSFTEDDLFALENLKNIKKVVSISDKLYNYYVAPAETSIEESSCITKMAKATDFYKTKETYWYKRRELLKRTLVSLRKFMDKETSVECAYARIFDFMIWELIIMDQMGVDRDSLIIEMQNIFLEKDFQVSLSLREKYGLYPKQFAKKELKSVVKDYIKCCYEMSDYAKENSSFNLFNACLYVFINRFMMAFEPVSNSDIMGRAYNELKNNLTFEARYVNDRYTQTGAVFDFREIFIRNFI